MAHPDVEAAVAEPEVVATEPDNSEVDTTEKEADVSDFYPEDQPTEPEEPADDDDLQEDEGEEGEFEGEDEEDDEPVEDIAAPVSLKAEHKELFTQLPPEAQRLTSEIIGQREKDAQQGVEKAMSAQREAERSAADKVAETQRDYAERFERFTQAFAPQPPQRQQFASDQEFLVARENYRDQAAMFQQLVQEIDGVKGKADGHFQAQEQEWRQEQFKQLMGVPEFADEATRADFIKGVESFAMNDLGYSQDEIIQAGAKDIMGLKKAMSWKTKADKWDAYLAKRNERPRKAGKFAKPAPAGGRTAATQQVDPLKAQYPND